MGFVSDRERKTIFFSNCLLPRSQDNKIKAISNIAINRSEIVYHVTSGVSSSLCHPEVT